MEYITTKDAAKRFNKSISTIKRVVSVAPDNALQYEPSRTAKNRRLFISVEYLESKFSVVRDTTTSHHQDSTTLILQKELQDKQNTIDKLLQNQEAFLERQRELNILIDRANQRAALLEKHFDRNRRIDNTDKTDEVIQEESIIDDIIADNEPINNDSDFINANDEESFTAWLKSMKNN